jgi:2-polyprenyl-3-methyl-5-hydroxy-6-metoxy-1,4-benzoquinol methylase
MTFKQILYLLACICLLALNFNYAFADTKLPIYQQYPPTAEGTGKVYMGREIAHIMGYQGAAWLERQEREREERTDILVKSLNLKAGMTIADVGAGTGYLSRRMADSIGAQGTIYAVDVQPEMIGKLKSLSKNYPTIKPILGDVSDVKLPANSVDMAILVDVYHELEYPYEMAQSILAALKPNGQLVLVEYRAEDDAVPIKQTHKMSEQQVIKELTMLPLSWQKTISKLPWQHVIVFSKN